ncbi:MAG TPA: ABC transporter permease [Burkholderiaceae bacterium]
MSDLQLRIHSSPASRGSPAQGLRAGLAGLLCGLALHAVAEPAPAVDEPYGLCGHLHNVGQYGPYDYRKDLDKLPIVLGAHFTPEVESLTRGRTSGTPGGDIDYTLRAIPNNPRALVAMVRLGEKEKTQQPAGAKYIVECYLERGIRFAPDDQIARMIYASFLIKANRFPEAAAQLGVAQQLDENNPFTQYNLGLLYFEMKDYDKALAQAQRSYAQGMRQPDLRDKLTAVGHWVEPAAESASSPASAASGAPP